MSPGSHNYRKWPTNHKPSWRKDKNREYSLVWYTMYTSLRLTSLNAMVPLNVTILSSQYGGRLQSKWLHYQKPAFRNEGMKKKKKKKKKNLPWMWRTDRKVRPSGSQSDITRQTSLCQAVTLGTDFLSTPHTHDRFLHSYFSTIIYFVGTHKKRLVGALLLSTHNICFLREIRKNTDTFWSVKVPYQKP